MIDYLEFSVARAYTRFVTDIVVQNACIGRQLAGMAKRSGFDVAKVIQSRPYSRTSPRRIKFLASTV